MAWAEAEEDSRRKSVVGEKLEAAIKKAGGEVMNFAPPRRPEEAAPFVVQEARRLVYVGMTRARERLVLTRVERRFGMEAGGSAFLEEMGLQVQGAAAE